MKTCVDLSLQPSAFDERITRRDFGRQATNGLMPVGCGEPLPYGTAIFRDDAAYSLLLTKENMAPCGS